MINFLAIPESIKAGVDLFRVGHELEHAAAWKNVQMVGNALSALLIMIVAISHLFGYAMPVWLNDALMQYLAAGIAAFANVILTVTTSTKVGLPNALPPIELVGRSEEGDASADRHDPMASDPVELHDQSLPSHGGPQPGTRTPDGNPPAGWNG